MIEPKSKCYFSIRVSGESATDLFPFLNDSVIKSALVSSASFETDMEAIHHANKFAELIPDGDVSFSPFYIPNQTEAQCRAKIIDETEEAYKIHTPFVIMEVSNGTDSISVDFKPFDFPNFAEVLANSKKALS